MLSIGKIITGKECWRNLDCWAVGDCGGPGCPTTGFSSILARLSDCGLLDNLVPESYFWFWMGFPCLRICAQSRFPPGLIDPMHQLCCTGLGDSTHGHLCPRDLQIRSLQFTLHLEKIWTLQLVLNVVMWVVSRSCSLAHVTFLFCGLNWLPGHFGCNSRGWLSPFKSF